MDCNGRIEALDSRGDYRGLHEKAATPEARDGQRLLLESRAHVLVFSTPPLRIEAAHQRAS